MKHILLHFFVCLAFISYAQESPISYEWHYTAGGLGDDFLGALAVDQDGNTILAGSFEDTIIFGDQNFVAGDFMESGYVAKLDPDGQLLWAKELTVSDGFDIALFDIELMPGGNFALAGSLWGTVDADLSEEELILESERDDIFLAIYGSDGDLQLATTIRGMGTNERAFEVISDNGNNLYIGGYVDDGDTFNDSPLLIKLDVGENPAIEWSFNVVTPGGNDDIKGLAVADGHVYIVGTFEGAVDFDLGDGETILDAGDTEGVFILKLNTEAEFVWAKHFKALSSNVLPSHMISDADENLYITGWFSGSTDFDPSEAELVLETSSRVPYLAKLDSEGELLWAQTAGTWQGEKVQLDSEGNVLISGESFNGGQIIKFAPSGDLIYEIEIPTSSFLGFDFADFFVDSNDDCYLGMEISNPFFYNPETMDELESVDEGDFVIVKYTEGGTVSSLAESLNEAGVNVFPNPVVDHVNVRWNEQRGAAYKLWVMDVEGKILTSLEFSDRELVNLPFPYPAGSYFLQIADAREVYRPIKVLKP